MATTKQREWISTAAAAELLGVSRKRFVRIVGLAEIRVKQWPSAPPLYRRADLLRLKEQSERFSNEQAEGRKEG